MSKKEQAMNLYFIEGQEPQEIARQLEMTQEEVDEALSDETALQRYRKRAEAARLRAEICLSESVEKAARKQAELLENDGDNRNVSQRAAKDILDRAGVRMENRQTITITFGKKTPKMGMPKRANGKAAKGRKGQKASENVR